MIPEGDFVYLTRAEYNSMLKKLREAGELIRNHAVFAHSMAEQGRCPTCGQEQNKMRFRHDP